MHIVIIFVNDFCLAGKWGNGMGKRANSVLGKGECGEFDPDVVYNVYKAIQVSIIALRILSTCSRNTCNNVQDTAGV